METNDVTEVLADTQTRMRGAVEAVAKELQSIRTGRANIGILNDIIVEYYGAPTPLNQLASLSAPDPQLLTIQPYDKGAMQGIERAIMQSDLGLNPNNDGVVIRLPIPELTTERREEMAKHVGGIAEHGKTAVRQVRRDANDRVKKLENDKKISQDEERRTHDTVQELTDKFCAEIDAKAEAKRSELLKL